MYEIRTLEPSRARISKKYQPAKPINAEGQKENGSKAVEDTNPNKTAKK
jgi:hypothetical protein